VDSDDFTETEQIFGRAEARLLLFDGAWQQKFGAAATSADRRSVESGTTSESTGTKGRLDYQSTFVFDTSTLADAAHSLSFYAEREHQDFRNRSEGFPSADQYRDSTDYGYVGEYRVGLWDRLFLSAALRFDDNERFEDATTYRATAAYVFPGSGTRLHGSYATGATNPTFFELFGFDPNTFVGNPDLKPETSKGWDAGIEQKLLGDRVVLDVTYFETDLRDEIQTAFLPGFRSTPVNLSGKSTRRGIEVAAQARVTDAFDLSGWTPSSRTAGPKSGVRSTWRAPTRTIASSTGGRTSISASTITAAPSTTSSSTARTGSVSAWKTMCWSISQRRIGSRTVSNSSAASRTCSMRIIRTSTGSIRRGLVPMPVSGWPLTHRDRMLLSPVGAMRGTA